ncbi:MAG: PAS domain-containing protein [Bacteroidota bacterium]
MVEGINSNPQEIKMKKPGLLSGGGEMGERLRTFDWSKTSVGPIDTWPQSLRTTLSIILNSKFPMFLFWGSEHICFYNDAYRPSLGNEGKHPNALGQRGEDCWPEIWLFIKPLIDQVLAGGEASWSEDQLLPIYRNGKLEDVYWTFSYSPVSDETGLPAGVFVTCVETTKTVETLQRLNLSEQRFQNLVREATVGVIVLSGQEMKVEVVNDMYGRLIDRTPEELLNKPLFNIIPEAEHPFRSMLDNVRLTGESLYLYEQPYFVYVNGEKKEGILNLVYQPYKETDGTITGVIAICQDVTEQVVSRKKAEASAHQLRSLIESAPFPIGVYVGKEMRIQFANQAILQVWAKGDDVIDRLYADILPELHNQEIFTQLDDVFTTGIPFHAKNQRIDLVVHGKLQSHYFNYSFTPLHDAQGQVYGIMNTAAEVTDLALAKKKVEEEKERTSVAIAVGELGVFEVDLTTDEIIADMRFHEIWELDGSISRGQYALRLHPDDVSVRGSALQKSLKTGVFDYEARLMRKDGMVRWVRSKGSVYYNDQGQPSRTFGIVQDITEQKNFAETLKESARRFQLLSESIPQIVWTALPDGNLDYFSQQWWDYSGMTLEQSLGQGWATAIHSDDLPLLSATWSNSLVTGKPYQVEARIRRADGAYRWMLIRSVALWTEQGGITQWMGTCTDLHEQKESEENLQSMAEELTAINEEIQTRNQELALTNQQLIRINVDLDNFIYTASHDLKAPISNIEALLQALLRTLSPESLASERAQRITGMMQESIERFKKTIASLTEVVKLQKENNAEAVLLDLAQVIQEVSLDLESMIAASGAQLEIDLVGDIAIRFSEKNLRSVVYNLLSNALKYRSPERVPQVYIRGETTSEYHILTVSDNGLGLEAGRLGQLFTMFKRFHNHVEGSGIGLYMVKKMIENAGGHIEVESQVGVGTTFRVYFIH